MFIIQKQTWIYTIHIIYLFVLHGSSLSGEESQGTGVGELQGVK